MKLCMLSVGGRGMTFVIGTEDILKLRACTCIGTVDMLACMETEDMLKLRAYMGTVDMLKLRACMGTEDTAKTL